MLKLLDNVYDIWTQMIDDGTIEDRKEYDKEMLLTMYFNGLPASPNELIQVNYLYRLIQTGFDPDAGSILSQDPKQIGETLQEACHQSLDGWEPGEKVIIELFLQDIAKAVKLSYQTPDGGIK